MGDLGEKWWFSTMLGRMSLGTVDEMSHQPIAGAGLHQGSPHTLSHSHQRDAWYTQHMRLGEVGQHRGCVLPFDHTISRVRKYCTP